MDSARASDRNAPSSLPGIPSLRFSARARAALICCLLLCIEQGTQAAQPTSVAPAQAPRITIGEQPISPAEVGRALVDCAQHSPETPAHACLDQFFVPRWLMDRAAVDQKLGEHPGMARTLDDLLHLALVQKMSAELKSPTDAAVEQFIQKHPRDFNKPLRIRIFRLLVNTETEAQTLLAELKPPLDLTQFRALCRKHSVDRATNERGGDLGFVWPDGSTDVPEVRADKNLYLAALSLKEGQWSEQPVAEDRRFAIVWRRGSLPPEPSAEADRQLARALLLEQMAENNVTSLLSSLKAAQVKQRSDVLLGRLRRKNTQLFVEP